MGQFLKSINTMQTYGQSCLYLHICLSFLITTTAVSLEKNIPCSKSHLDLIGGGSGSPRGGGTTPEWLHEPTANLHEKPGTKNTQNNLSIGKKNTKHAATANFQHAYQKHAPVWNITKQCHKLKMSEKKKVP